MNSILELAAPLVQACRTNPNEFELEARSLNLYLLQV